MRERLRDWLGLNVALSAVAMRLTETSREISDLQKRLDWPSWVDRGDVIGGFRAELKSFREDIAFLRSDVDALIERQGNNDNQF